MTLRLQACLFFKCFTILGSERTMNAHPIQDRAGNGLTRRRMLQTLGGVALAARFNSPLQALAAKRVASYSLRWMLKMVSGDILASYHMV
jgi:hypothetical protein